MAAYAKQGYGYFNEELPDLRKIKAECKYSSGLEPETSDEPKVVTLAQKAVDQMTYKKLLAIAGVAKRNIETPFSIMEKQIVSLRSQSRTLMQAADELEKQLSLLKNLAVIE